MNYETISKKKGKTFTKTAIQDILQQKLTLKIQKCTLRGDVGRFF